MHGIRRSFGRFVHQTAVFVIVALLLVVTKGIRSDSATPTGRVTANVSEPATALQGEKAIEHLKQQGTYNSLQEAVAAAKYQAQWQPSPKLAGVAAAYELKNAKNNLLAYITADGLQMTSLGVSQTPWRLGLSLKGYGYGSSLSAFQLGEMTAKTNRVEISRHSPGTQHAALTEWFVNTSNGIEHGLTLPNAPEGKKGGDALMLRFQVTGDLQVRANESQSAVFFNRASDSLLLGYEKLVVVDAKGRAIKARMRIESVDLVMEVEDSGADYPLTIDPLFTQVQKLFASDPPQDRKFGISVSISSDTAVVGALEDDVASNSDQGSAYVFVRNGASWVQQQKLTASDGAASDQFGNSVSISGDTIVVAASLDDVAANTDQGSAYIFVRAGTTWTQQAKLTVSDGAASDNFGQSVAIDGDSVIVGASLDDIGQADRGSAYVFVRSGTTWSQQTKLTAADGALNDHFGASVGLHGDTAIIGAPTNDVSFTDQGSAYIFVRSGTTWSQQTNLAASDGALSDQFGNSVGIFGDTVVVGASLDDVGAADQGSAYTFVRSGTTWSEQAKLTAFGGAAGDQFGNSVGISGGTVVVGAALDRVGVESKGSAYIFIRSGTSWAQQQQLAAIDGFGGNRFGNSVAISGDAVIVGAHLAHVSFNFEGAAYIFSRGVGSWAPQGLFTASDGAANDRFGSSVGISGDTAVVGANLDDVGANPNQGSAYVFVRTGTTWAQQAKLTASDGAADDGFGYEIAIDGDTIIAGAPAILGVNNSPGAAYIFVRSGASWTEQQKLTASDGEESDRFGQSVAISAETVVIGALLDDIGANLQQGSAYVFVRTGTTWTQQAKLAASDGSADDRFGDSVAISGESVIVGAPFDNVSGNTDQGSAYVFVRSGSSWFQQQRLNGSDSDVRFGQCVGISGDTVVVGEGGSAYVFIRIGGSWTQQQNLTSSDDDPRDEFGRSVAISAGVIVVGWIPATQQVPTSFEPGSVTVFERTGASWFKQASLATPSPGLGENFGISVAISGDMILVGDNLESVGSNTDQGAAYLFVCNWDPNAQLAASDGAANDEFANSVSISGNTVVVGAHLDDVGANTNQGSAYVFVRIGQTWTQQQRLTASDGATSDTFGTSVAISGETIVIGAQGDDVGANGNQGSAYVFVRTGTSWTQQQKLVASDGAAGDNFANAVDITGDTIVVGAFQENSRQGSAYVFTRNGVTWTQQQKLTASDGAVSDLFATSVSISGNTVICGAPGDDVSFTNQGSAYVFVRSGVTWTLQQKLTASDPGLSDGFGGSVSISGDSVVVGADSDAVGVNSSQGSAYVFTRHGLAWTEQQKLTASDGGAGDNFGNAVAINGDTIVIGANNDDAPFTDQGSAYVFSRNGATWSERQQMTAPNGAVDDSFGAAVTISGNTIVVGANLADAGTLSNKGAAYIYFMSCNTSPVIVAGPLLTRQRGSLASTVPIASVSDSEDPNGFLSVTVASAPSGISIIGITNDLGTVSALVAVMCNAALGNNLVSLQVRDVDGGVGTVQFLVVVTANTPPAIGTYPTTNVLAGNTTTITPSAPPSDNGSIISLTASPSGFTGSLSVDAATGQIFISNTGTSGNHSVSVIAVDNCGSSALTTFQLNVTCPAITVNPASIPGATAGASYTQTFTQAGGILPITFSLTGTLPTGMTFSGATLSGTPTQVGTFPITVTATDQFNCPGSRGYTLTVAAPLAVWNGSTSADWHTATNWTPNVVPTSFSDVLIPTSGVTNQPSISASSASINAMTIQSSRVLTINSSLTLATAADVTTNGTIAGAGKLACAGATFTQNGTVSVSSVEFAAGPHALTGGGAFASGIVTVLGGASVSLTSNHSLSVLVINSGGSFDCSNQTLILTGAGTAIFNSGSFTATGSTIIYQGSVAQIVTANIDYQNLTANNGAGLSLAGDTSVVGQLNLLGDLTTGLFMLTMPASATSTGAGNVIGNVKRTGLTNGIIFSFSNPLTTIRFDTGAPPTDVTVNLVKTAPSGFSSNTISRTYTITPNGGSGFSATVRLHYEDSELNGVNESTLELWRYNGSTWQSPAGAALRDTSANWVEETGITGFSPWAIAGPSGPTAVDLIAFSAASYQTGALIEWRTGMEVANLGFNLYREANGNRELVNAQLIAGSALMVGAETAMTAGRSYEWFDDSPAASDASYWLEDIDTRGESTWHGPVSATRATTPLTPARLKQAQLLGNLGRTPIKSSRVESVGALASPTPSSMLMQSSIASGPAIKLGIKSEAWYRVTRDQLVAAGLDPSVDPRVLQLFVDGVEQPMLVAGEKDGSFDGMDSIEFYGVGLDTPSTDTRVYWLVAAKQPGRRIGFIDAPAKGDGATSFPYSVETKERTIYFSSLLNGDAENWFGRVVASQAVDQSLSLDSIDGNARGLAHLEIALQGVTQLPANLDHQVRVMLNGVMLGRILFDGHQHHTARFDIPHSSLVEGANTVTLAAEGGPSDISLIDYVRVSYCRKYIADADDLKVTVPGGTPIQTITGFSSPLIRVFDVSDSASIAELAGTVTGKSPSYSVTVRMEGSTERTLLAVTDDRLAQPASIAANDESSWRSASNGADLLIITSRELIPALEPLRALRQSQGLSVAIIDIHDAYDEFNFGQKSPQAVRDLLAYAKANWKKKPRFLMFAGDASIDPKDYLGLGDSDLVPTRLIETNYLETASDDWFSDFDDDGVADIAVGRLPVHNFEEVSLLVKKLIGYESSDPGDKAMLVADANEGFDFEAASRDLLSLIPSNLRMTQINRGALGTDTARQALLEGIRQGQKLINYTGHGSANVWRGDLLTTADAERLHNERLPVFVMMTCLNGYFHDVRTDSLAESLLKAEQGGAIAVWASTGMTLPGQQAAINQELYKLIFSDRAMTLGDAARQAKLAASDRDIRRTWILLGDPTMRVR